MLTIAPGADHDACEDDQRDAVADAPLGDLLAEPHDEGGPCGQGQHRQQAEPPAGVGHQESAARRGGLLQEEGDPEALDHRQHDGAVARVLGDLAAPELTLLGELLEVGPHHRQQLQDDRRRDVRHDPQREDRHSPERPTREEVEEPEHRALRGLGELGNRLRVDPDRGDVRPQTVDRQQREGEDDSLAQVGDGKDVPEALDHDDMTSQ